MPLWLVHAFNRKYMAVVNFRALSWDDPASFGRPYPKGANRTARAKKRLLSVAVYNAVNDKLKRDPETPIDKSLFDEIGRPFAIGATLAGEFFYYQKQVMDTISPKGKNPAKNGKIAGLQRRRK